MHVEPGKPYDDLENEIIYIKENYEYYFDHLLDTFKRAESLLEAEAQAYLKKHNEEHDVEVKWSNEQFPDHYHKSEPLIALLRSSCLITVHSEFETIWKRIVEIYNSGYKPKKHMKISNKYTFDLTNCLDRTVQKYDILISYNYIRNKIVHQDAGAGTELDKLQCLISDNKIKHFKIKYEPTQIVFSIESLDFVYSYIEVILRFMEAIADALYVKRTK